MSDHPMPPDDPQAPTVPHYVDDSVTLWHGDCIEVMRTLPDCSVDAVVCDPPYGLGFMGKDWDKAAQMASVPPSAAARIANGIDVGRMGNLPGGKGQAAVAFDGKAFQRWCEQWAQECLRVLKPGGHMLAFGGTRTWHRLACAVEDAGFEVRDSIAWLYGSGFPKSLDVSKAIDKQRHAADDVRRATAWIAAHCTARALDEAAGTNGMGGHWTTQGPQASIPTTEAWERIGPLLPDAPDWLLALIKPARTPGEAWGSREVIGRRTDGAANGSVIGLGSPSVMQQEYDATAPATDAARTWQGWGTALKPAFEPVVVARKPLSGTVAQSVLTWGTGALNIDACRVTAGKPDGRTRERSGEASRSMRYAEDGRDFHATPGPRGSDAAGRWPANVVLSDDQAAELDRQSGNRPGMSTQRDFTAREGTDGTTTYGKGVGKLEPGVREGFNDSGGASRFFPTFRYEAKAPTVERPRDGETAHPTVKPLDLMRWLVRLVTPPGGTVLEPFAGSGTTAEACVIEGFRCIAIEREAAYLPLIVARLSKPIQPDLFGGAA